MGLRNPWAGFGTGERTLFIMSGILMPQVYESGLPDQGVLAGQVADLLLAPRATLPAKLFYDQLGSSLFTAITHLDEYYLSRAEGEIIAAHGAEIARHAGQGKTLMDLGAGDCMKASRLFDLFRPVAYVAVDISAAHLRSSLECLQRQFPALPMTGVCTDFAEVFRLPPGVVTGPCTGLYLGSSIGNFPPEQAVRLLGEIRQSMPEGRLLLGADLVKRAPVLERAYDDALGVTAAFNLNILRHVNRILGADFDTADFSHRAVFNAAESRIEMHLCARRPVEVSWTAAGGGHRRFAQDETIHTENSCKYTLASLEDLLQQAGFASVRFWTDCEERFALALAFS